MSRPSRWRNLADDALAVLPAWLVARVLTAAAFVLAIVVADRLTPGARPHQIDEGLLAWDGTWYRDIATGGYALTGEGGVRFFPLFPLLGRILGLGISSAAGPVLVVVANVSSYVLLILVRRLVVFEGKGRATAARAVLALYVSTETTARGAAFKIPSTTGSNRACSSSALTAACTLPAREPGRVLSAPISSTSAPSSSSRNACSTAASVSRYSPPSLNESYVTFTTPITSVCRPSARVRVRSFHSAGMRLRGGVASVIFVAAMALPL